MNYNIYCITYNNMNYNNTMYIIYTLYINNMCYGKVKVKIKLKFQKK